MTGIKVLDVAHVRFGCPDLGRMRSFLEDFGLRAYEDAIDGVLYMRGSGPQPFLHVTEPGEPGFRGLALQARDRNDLERLAREEGLAVEPLDAPGGGLVVTLRDPDGYAVSVVWGQVQAAEAIRPPRVGWNDAGERLRVCAVKRIPPSPAEVVRLGHVVLSVSDFRASERWWKTRFGLLTSDEIRLPDGMALGAFLRCDRGDEPTDHHSLFLAQLPSGVGFNHAAFEVRDLDDLMVGHQRLRERGHTQSWGIGRHTLGSQVFDYWLDPWGHQLEHWTDGDLFTAADLPQVASLAELMAVQWGPAAPGHA